MNLWIQWYVVMIGLIRAHLSQGECQGVTSETFKSWRFGHEKSWRISTTDAFYYIDIYVLEFLLVGLAGNLTPEDLKTLKR